MEQDLNINSKENNDQLVKTEEFLVVDDIENVDTVSVSRGRLYFIFGFLIVIVLITIVTIFFLYKKTQVVKTNTSSNAATSTSISDTQAQLNEALLFLDKIVVLPKNDQPVLIRVSDPTQLRSDSFFDDSRIDDRVVIYPNIGRAILYRPLTGQIVNIASFKPDPRQAGTIYNDSNEVKINNR